MKPLTKKILEAGLIDKAVAQLMEKWGMLSPEETAIASREQMVVETLENFIEDVEILLQPESIERKETKL